MRPTVSFDRPQEDRFGHYVGALIGLSTPGLRDRDAMPDLTKLHFAGLLSGQTRNAEGLGAILTAFFDMPVRVESFVGAWLSLEHEDLTRLGDGGRTGGARRLGGAGPPGLEPPEQVPHRVRPRSPWRSTSACCLAA